MKGLLSDNSYFDAFFSKTQVTVDAVLKTLSENAEKATRIILAAVPVIARESWTETYKEIKVTQPKPSATF